MLKLLYKCFTVCILIILYIFISGTMELSNLSLEQICIKLEAILKCPICYEYLEPPVDQCERGHSVCGQCQKTVKKCPLCSGPFISFKATILTQVVEVLPRVCKYRYKGCSVISFPKDMHIYLCEFREAKCYLCGAMTFANLLLKHFEKAHKKIHAMDKLSGPIEEFKLSENTTKISLFSLFGHLFWRKISADVEKKLFSVTFIFVPMKKPNKTYFADIKLKKDSWEYSSFSVIRIRKDMNMEAAVPNIIVPLAEMIKLFGQNVNCLSFECLNVVKALDN